MVFTVQARIKRITDQCHITFTCLKLEIVVVAHVPINHTLKEPVLCYLPRQLLDCTDRIQLSIQYFSDMRETLLDAMNSNEINSKT